MTVRTVLIGFGWSGRKIWLPRLLGRDDYEVVAAVDPDPVQRAAFTAATDRPAYADVGALGTGMADLAIVAVPNYAHAAVARSVLLRGLAVFVEKPVCLTVGEVDDLAEAARRGRARLLTGSAARYRADVAALAKLVPELGQLRGIELSWIRMSGIPQRRGWFTDRTRAGGGVLVDLGWHLLDVLEEIAGPVTFVRAAAVMTDDHVNDPEWAAAWRHDPEVTGTAADVEDTVRGFLVAQDGMSVGLRASWASHSVSHDVTSIEVEGSEGTATLRCTFGFSPSREPESRVTHICRGRRREIPVPAEPIGAEHDRQLDELRHCLADRRSPEQAIAGVRRIVRAIEALYAAGASYSVTAGSAAAEAVGR